ncbi:unnamed protein product, partial [marine sediment metagenome]
MMKVDRYLYGRTNVEQLKSGRAALRTPEQTAAEAYAPYGAVAEISDTVSKAMVVQDERRKKIQEKEDQIQLKMMDEQIKLFGVEMKNDPRYQDQVQPDGSMTGPLILEDFEAGMDEIEKGFENIQNPTTRANAEKLFSLSREGGRLETRTMVNDMSEAWIAKAEFDFRDLAIAAGDWAEANSQTESLRDKDLISQEQYEGDINQIQKAEIEQESSLILEAFDKSQDKDAFYASLATNKTLDPEVKKSAISKVE